MRKKLIMLFMNQDMKLQIIICLYTQAVNIQTISYTEIVPYSLT